MTYNGINWSRYLLPALEKNPKISFIIASFETKCHN